MLCGFVAFIDGELTELQQAVIIPFPRHTKLYSSPSVGAKPDGALSVRVIAVSSLAQHYALQRTNSLGLETADALIGATSFEYISTQYTCIEHDTGLPR